MSRIRSFRALFQRPRRPGDIVFAWAALAVAVFLLFQLRDQTAWNSGGKLFAQPRFWPAVSLAGMTFFAMLHLAGSALSERIPGRWQELRVWLASLEYAGWFVVYAAIMPWLGYLPATLIVAVLLVLRLGYRSGGAIGAALAAALAIVVIFRSLLQVKLPSGRLYEALPDGLRQIMLTWF